MTTDHPGEVRFALFDTLLNRFEPGRLIDLGTGHGKFAIRAAEAGWETVAVDARTERFPDYPGVTWRQENIGDTDLTGYDLIVNLGLFYHLGIDDQLSLLDRAAGTPMILDTHVGVPSETGFGLSRMTRQRGYRGRLYSEKDKQHDPRSSFGNAWSFWPAPRALVRMLTERGWDVFTAQPYYQRSRTFFLCLPRRRHVAG
ncbi:MAG TPA: class I SAM-dependent methyltransferase [Nocardioidaceae bacterium]|nr:class I SAM-dependent methyltransferase [Nocardioidaceae bacterium]